MTPFHLAGPQATPLLPGLTLLEASAGTGKTYTIAGLMVRLVVEEGIPLQRIAVMTFTRAATAELRDRIRSALADGAEALGGGVPRGIAGWMVSRLPTLAPAEATAWRRRLAQALSDIDAAPITTIHGFMGAVARDHAAQVGIDGQATLSLDLAPWRRQVVRDWFVTHLRDLPPVLTRQCGSAPLQRLERIAQAVEEGGLTTFVAPEQPWPELCAELQPLLDPRLVDALETAWNAAVADYSGNSKWSKRFFPARLANLRRLLAGGAITLAAASDGLDEDAHAKALRGAGVPADLRARLATLFQLLGEVPGAVGGAFAAHYRAALEARRSRPGLVPGDLVRALMAALTTTPELAAAIGSRADAVLVDEFQDTDLVQWRILEACFTSPVHRLVLIGDPKQAIYAFRGADVYAYLAARNRVPEDRRFSLDVNYRSDAAVVAGLNALYAGLPDPVAVSGIGVPAVTAARPDRLQPGRLEPEAVQVWCLPFTGNQDAVSEQVVTAIVQEITRLLDPAQGVVIDGVGTPRPRDVAVIVRRNEQAATLHRALAQAGVPAVRQDRSPVTGGDAARELVALLQACRAGARTADLLRAAGTRLVGAPAGDLAAVEPGPALAALPDHFQGLGAVFDLHGLAAWWYALLDRDLGWGVVRVRLSHLGDGGRALMDLHHLIETWAPIAAEQGLGVVELASLLAQAIADPASDPEDPRRLERDDDAVRLVTVHASKGLQYPIVFEAFAWTEVRPDALPVVHPGDGPRAERHLGILDAEDLAQADRERLGDELRRLYVGLTRAEHRLYLIGALPGERRTLVSATAWMLAPRPSPFTLAAIGEGPRAAVVHAATAGAWSPPAGVRLASPPGCGGTVRPVPPPPVPGGESVVPPVVVRKQWWRSSFTALARQHATPDDGTDHDHHPVAAVPVAEDDAYGGPALGTLVHAAYQHGDFAAWAADVAVARRDLDRHLALAGMTLSESQAARLAVRLQRSVADPVPGLGVAVAALDPQAVAREWPVRLAVRHASRPLARVFAGRTPLAPDWPDTLGATALPPGTFTAVLDALVVHEGRYHLIDWKTNRLPAYDPPVLAAALADEHYLLQAHLYLLALDRFLALRVPAYDPVRHLGQAHYAFIRGADQPSGGWIAVAPDLEILEALRACC